MRKPRTEPEHVRAAFERYLSQPTPRKLRLVATHIKRPLRTVQLWSQRWDWKARVLAADRKKIDAAAAEADEERATKAVLKNFYQSMKLLMADFAATQKKRHDEGGPVTANEAHTAMRILEMLHKDYADTLKEPDDA